VAIDRDVVKGGAGGGVAHARQPFEADVINPAKAMHDGIEQGTQDSGVRDFELAAQLGFRTPVDLCNGERRRYSSARAKTASGCPWPRLFPPRRRRRADCCPQSSAR
jgi:hypothetical protein